MYIWKPEFSDTDVITDLKNFIFLLLLVQKFLCNNENFIYKTALRKSVLGGKGRHIDLPNCSLCNLATLSVPSIYSHTPHSCRLYDG
jgi:hypothetical protein